MGKLTKSCVCRAIRWTGRQGRRDCSHVSLVDPDNGPDSASLEAAFSNGAWLVSFELKGNPQWPRPSEGPLAH